MTETKVAKVTKRDNINSLLKRTDLTDNERTYLMHELELIDKKNAYRSKADIAKSKENVTLEELIVKILAENGGGMSCSQIAAECSKKLNSNFTPQRITPRLSALQKDLKVEKYAEKGSSFYKVVA